MMNVEINKIIELEIIDVNYDGLGVSRIDNKVCFVSGAITGETIKACVDYINKDYIKAHVVEVVKASKSRECKLCESYPKCGGCQLLHIKYVDSLEIKKKSVIDTLRKIGHIDYNIKEIFGMDNPNGYRNKVQIPVGTEKGKIITGYYQGSSHTLIPFKKCLLQSNQVNDILLFLKNIFNEYKITAYDEQTKKGCLRHFLIRENYEGKLMVVFVTNEEKISHLDEIVKKIISRYPSVISVIQNINKKDSNVILGQSSKILFGKDEITDKINDVYYHISHHSFFQVNRIQTEKLYNIVLDYVGSKNNVIDAYCGVGSISLAMSKNVKKIYGIEVVEQAIIDAKNNAKLNNINNCEFIVGKVEEKIFDLLDKKIDCVVIDPPRKGLDFKVVEALKNSNIKDVIYVSCNPATLARDLNYLSEKYEIKDIKLVDMFAYTTGVESVVKLERKGM